MKRPGFQSQRTCSALESAEHAEPAVREMLRRARAQIEEIAAQEPPIFATVVEPLEELHHAVARTWSPLGHLNAVLNSEALRSAYNRCLPMLSSYQTDLAQNEPLYKAYRLIEERERAVLDPVQRAVLEHALRDFRLAGVELPAADKERLKSVMLELTQLQAKFQENILDATNAWSHHIIDKALMCGLNEMLVDQARRRAHERQLEGWILILDQPTYAAVVTNAESETLRRVFYEAWTTVASDRGPHAGRWDNAPVMEQILSKRHEMARILGFDNYAEYALTTRMAHSVAEVMQLLDEVGGLARQAAAKEFEELRAFAGRELEAWDVPFYLEQLQRGRSVSQEELRHYFPLPQVLTGLFYVADRLFGVRIRERFDVPLWHPDVRFFEIYSDAGAAVGSFYLDAYARPQKRSGAWMDECIGRKQLLSGASLPVAYLVCNVLPPSGSDPALLTHNDVLSLFHEFGHCLHHLMTRVDYPSIAGINGVALDAVELPSQFMENFAWHPEVLSRISSHVRTAERLPIEVQRRLRATRSLGAGLRMIRKVELALFDFQVHVEYAPEHGARVRQVLEAVRRRVVVTPVPEWNRFENSFRHIFAGRYAAGVYSYIWAELLAADAFAAFEERGVFDRPTAQLFLDSILSRGASRDTLDAFVEFRGRRPQIDAFLEQYGFR
jgi:oligopeptidase A